jgi:hypothetical protein
MPASCSKLDTFCTNVVFPISGRPKFIKSLTTSHFSSLLLKILCWRMVYKKIMAK